MDEQHSRSQRKFGCAPYCTATFINDENLVFYMHSIDDEGVTRSNVMTKAGAAAKSKAKVAHCEAMKSIVAIFEDSGCSLRYFVTDQSTDGSGDAESYFRPVWEKFIMNFDIWHKVKEFDAIFKTIACERVYARGTYCEFSFNLFSCHLQ